MDKKYEILNDRYIIINGRKLFRIRALKDFQTIQGLTVKVGDLGGYIQSEKNLSQEGNCWVANDAKVFDNAYVCDNARVFDNASVCGNAMVYNSAFVSENACVYGNAKVFDNASVYGDACVSNDAWISDNACVSDNTCVCGNAYIFENAYVYGKTCVCSNAEIGNNADICNDRDYICIKGLGSISATTFYKCKDNQIGVTCGFFKGTLDEFISHLKSTHKDTKFDKEYLAVVEAVKIHFGLDKNTSATAI